MPTYSIHHFSAIASKPAPRSKSAKRIAMRSLGESVATRRTLRRAA